MTHGDVIRCMTDEDLAEFMTVVVKYSAEILCKSLTTVKVDLSKFKIESLTETHLEWLKQEVRDGQK